MMQSGRQGKTKGQIDKSKGGRLKGDGKAVEREIARRDERKDEKDRRGHIVSKFAEVQVLLGTELVLLQPGRVQLGRRV